MKIFQILVLISSWTFFCWIFFADTKNTHNQVREAPTSDKCCSNGLLRECDLRLKAHFSKQVRAFSDTLLSRQELGFRKRTVLNLNRRKRLNESALVAFFYSSGFFKISFKAALVQPLMPNVPLQLWEENKEKLWFSNTSCGRWLI